MFSLLKRLTGCVQIPIYTIFYKKMNHYSQQFGGEHETTKSNLKALMLMYLASNDFDLNSITYQKASLADGVLTNNSETITTASATLPFSLSNLGTTSAVKWLTYSTEFQGVEEGFDKPIVETGDLVILAVSRTEEQNISKYFNDYVKFNVGANFQTKDSGLQTMNIYIGVSNSAKSDFNDPFVEAHEKVIASQIEIAALLEKYGVVAENDL